MCLGYASEEMWNEGEREKRTEYLAIQRERERKREGERERERERERESEREREREGREKHTRPQRKTKGQL